jgi:hypothetical protein
MKLIVWGVIPAFILLEAQQASSHQTPPKPVQSPKHTFEPFEADKNIRVIRPSLQKIFLLT